MPYRTSARTFLGDVDVTDIDLTKPFTVDFSVPANAPIFVKRAALERARSTHAAFDAIRRRWLIKLDLDLVNSGKCIVYVCPLPGGIS